MDEVKRCSHSKALEMLFKGAFVFTEIRKDITEEKRGCRKCGEIKNGNFCSNCGSKLSNKMIVKIGSDVTKLRLSYHHEKLYIEAMKQGEKFYRNSGKCKFSLEFFMKQNNWSWIWR